MLLADMIRDRRRGRPPDGPPPPGFKTTAEAAAVLRVKEDTVRGYIRSRRLKARKVRGTRRWLIADTDLAAALEGGLGSHAPRGPEEHD
jgi:excisionase family DNA binding protein